jgi:hypothetical protein
MCEISLCCADRFKSSLRSQLSCFWFFFVFFLKGGHQNNKHKKEFSFSFFGVICGSYVNSIGSDLMDRRSLGSLSLYNRCVFYPFLGLLFLFFLFLVGHHATLNFESAASIDYSLFACRPWFIDRRLIPFTFGFFRVPNSTCSLRNNKRRVRRWPPVCCCGCSLFSPLVKEKTWVNGCRHRFLSL